MENLIISDDRRFTIQIRQCHTRELYAEYPCRIHCERYPKRWVDGRRDTDTRLCLAWFVCEYESSELREMAEVVSCRRLSACASCGIEREREGEGMNALGERIRTERESQGLTDQRVRTKGKYLA